MALIQATLLFSYCIRAPVFITPTNISQQLEEGEGYRFPHLTPLYPTPSYKNKV